MTIVHQGSTATTEGLAEAQGDECSTANHPSSLDIERMLRADRTRFTHYSTVASGLAASWREVSR